MSTLTPAAPLQVAVMEALRGDAGLAAAFGCAPRVYDRPPNSHQDDAGREIDGPRFPYLTGAEVEIYDDSNTCAAAFEAFVTVHVWSREVGQPEAKRLGDAVAAALNTELQIEGFICTHHEFRSARYLPDPDGLTTHGVIVVRLLIDPA